MRAIVIKKRGALDSLVYEDNPEPEHITMTRLTSFAVTAVLTLALAGIAGALAQSGRSDERPGQAEAAPIIQGRQTPAQAKVSQPANDGILSLHKTRRDLAQKGYESALPSLRATKRFGDTLVGVGKPEDVYRWSIRLLQAERDLSSTETDHLTALQAHLARMIDLEKNVGSLSSEISPEATKLEVQWYVLEARLFLEQAKPK